MSEQKFPPRIKFSRLYPSVELLSGDFEHNGTPIHYISLTEHQHLMAEKDKRIERLREALKRCLHARQCNAPHGQMEKMPTVHELKTALQEETK